VRVVFEPWMSERVLERSHLRHRLEGAIGAGGLLLELQPVVRPRHRRVERLRGARCAGRTATGAAGRASSCRWPRSPACVVPMGTWVLREALAAARRLAGRAGRRRRQRLAAAARGDRFARLVTSALAAAGVAPERLTLEITEQTAVDDLGRTASRLAPLRELGVHVAVDDFGTGFSSMRYLTRLPVDALKIDRQFVDGLGVRPRDEVLVVSMLRLAADLDLDVVAEGVETARQAEILQGHGCRLAQGYLFSRRRGSCPSCGAAALRRPHPGRPATAGGGGRRVAEVDAAARACGPGCRLRCESLTLGVRDRYASRCSSRLVHVGLDSPVSLVSRGARDGSRGGCDARRRRRGRCPPGAGGRSRAARRWRSPPGR
jgi:EAL domain-containing protein (putative c-di-GMP-specific phosphodiesterase class I)